jgi:choline kinase
MYAAGISGRLETHAPEGIKGLIDFEGTKLMQYQLNWMTLCKPDSIVIVLGLEHQKIRDEFGDQYNGVDIHYVYNHDYNKKGNMLSLWAAREYCDRDTLFTTSDLLCHPSDIKIFMSADYSNKILIDSSSSLFLDPDPVKVSIQDEKIVRVLKRMEINEISGIAIGVYMFSKDVIGDLLDTIHSDIKRNDDDKSLYYAVNSITKKHNIMPVFCKKKEWFDIDTKEEVSLAREYLKMHYKDFELIKTG